MYKIIFNLKNNHSFSLYYISKYDIVKTRNQKYIYEPSLNKFFKLTLTTFNSKTHKTVYVVFEVSKLKSKFLKLIM